MNIGEIAERFIEACRVDLSSGTAPGPRRVKSVALPYSHDWNDKAGWGSERLAEDRKQFWEKLSSQPTAADISEADRTMAWLSCVPDDSERACLVAWASAHVGGESFKQWCFRQGFHPMTGTRRKDRALEHICLALGGSIIQHGEMAHEGVLIATPEISDVDAILSDLAPYRVPFVENEPEGAFSWAAKRNERRRQREAKRKREKVAA